MNFDAERLYELLPAFYRIRDVELAKQLGGMLDAVEQAELQTLQHKLSSNSPLSEEESERFAVLEEKRQRGPLKALLSVIAEQVAVLEEDLDQLYDDLFIETSDEWVVPYLGDLVGARGLMVFPGAPISPRAQVANTIAYRKRKGTAAVLEQLTRDVTGWDASVVEYFQRLATTQYMNHLRPQNIAVVSLRRRSCAGLNEGLSHEAYVSANQRQWEAIERLNTPFDSAARTVDVHSIASRRGKYNIPNVGIFLWRLGSYPLQDAPAFKVDDRRYLFDALGKDTPLYNKVEAEDEITHLAEPINVPMPISRRVLDRYLDTYYGKDKSILIKEGTTPILPGTVSPPVLSPPAAELSDLIEACDLSDVKDGSGTVVGWAHKPQAKIAIDPVLGRIAFPENRPPPQDVHVSYYYGFGAEMGGGQYGRATTFTSDDAQTLISVTSGGPTIQQALDQLTTALAGPNAPLLGVAEIQDNEYYLETPVIHVPAGVPKGRTVALRAADERRPLLVPANEVEVFGGENATVTLNGLVICGSLRVPLQDAANNANKLQRLRLRHCTLLPGLAPAIQGVAGETSASPRLVVERPNVNIEIDHCIVGALRVVDGAHVRVTNSIIDAGAETKMAYAALDDQGAGAPLEIENSTVIGRMHTLMLKLASNTIFLASASGSAPIDAERLQQGCVRFSYVPPGSRVPRQYNCQPSDAADAPRMRPVFTSLNYGDAGYGQLSLRSVAEVRRGADDDAEMGAFHHLYQPQRETSLRIQLEEYLRFGLEAGIFYAS